MAEPTASNYVGGASLDTDTSLFGDAVNLKQLSLDAGISSAATTISVAESITAVNVPCYVLIGSELVLAEAKSAGDFTSCIRGVGGTVAAAHISGDAVYVVFGANQYNQLKRAIIAIETELGISPSGASVDVAARLALLATLASPTFTGTVILPKTVEIQDTSADHQYVLAVSELTADRIVTLPLLTANDTFVFSDHAQTLTNKTLTRPITINPAETHQILTDGATVNWNMDSGASAQITLAGNRTMAAPTNLRAGASYLLLIIQDSTGSRTITWNSVFKWAGGTVPVLSTTANAKDIISFWSDGTNLYGGSIIKGLA